MASARIIRAAAAKLDILDIWSYIATENSPTVADAMLERFSEKLALLAVNPMIGRKRSDLSGAPRGFVVQPYTIIYEPLSARDGILVWRILHGARDLRFIVKPPSADRP